MAWVSFQTLPAPGQQEVVLGRSTGSDGQRHAPHRNQECFFLGHRTGKSLALGYVKIELSTQGTELLIDIYGEKRKAVVIPEVLYDPQNEKLRA